MQLQEQLNKIMDDYKSISKTQETLINDTMSQINDLKDEGQSAFLKKSLQQAKSGELSISSFLEKIKDLKNGN